MISLPMLLTTSINVDEEELTGEEGRGSNVAMGSTQGSSATARTKGNCLGLDRRTCIYFVLFTSAILFPLMHVVEG